MTLQRINPTLTQHKPDKPDTKGATVIQPQHELDKERGTRHFMKTTVKSKKKRSLRKKEEFTSYIIEINESRTSPLESHSPKAEFSQTLV